MIGRLETVERLEKIERLETVGRLEKVARLEAIEKLEKIGRLEAVERPVKMEDQKRSKDRWRKECEFAGRPTRPKVTKLESIEDGCKTGSERRKSKDRKRSDCEFTGWPTRLKVKRVEENGQRPGGTGRVTRTGFCQKKRSYHKGDSIGIRGSLR